MLGDDCNELRCSNNLRGHGSKQLGEGTQLRQRVPFPRTDSSHDYLIVYVLQDDVRKKFSAQLRAKMLGGEPFVSEYHNYPDQASTGHVVFDDEALTKTIESEQAGFRKLFGGVLHRRRQDCGEQLYQAIGVAKSDKPGKMAQLAKNADFFDAPCGLIVTVDRVYERAQWGNVGMFLATFALLCEEAGLGTCFQGFFGLWGKAIKGDILKEVVEGGGGGIIPEREVVWCGVAVGYCDKKAAINGYRTPRADLRDWCKVVAKL